MLTRTSWPQSRLTSFGFVLIVFCLVPYLLDVAVCEEFFSIPLHQPVLVDGEDVDPSEVTGTSVVHGDPLLTTSELRTREANVRTVVQKVPPALPSNLAGISLTSRPPPPWAFV